MMLKKIFAYLSLGYIACALFLTPFEQIRAQNFTTCVPGEYCALSTVPGITESGEPADPTKIVTNIYGISIGIAAILAIGMIIWAGIQYATTEAITGKSEAKQHWQGALWGLLLLLSSYLILRTINVDLVKQDLSLGAPISCVDKNGVTCGVAEEERAMENLRKALDERKAKEVAQRDAADKKISDLQNDLAMAKAEGNTAEIERLEKELAQTEGARTEVQNKIIKTQGYMALRSFASNFIGQFDEATKSGNYKAMQVAAATFERESKQRLGMSSSQKLFTPAEISAMTAQFAAQVDYMRRTIQWMEQKVTDPGAERPPKPSFSLPITPSD